MVTARDVANYFLVLADDDAGDLISNLKIQKLVYYAQGFHLAAYGKPLFEETIRAWAHGPVVPSLYQDFKDYSSGPIPAPHDGVDLDKFAPEQKELLNDVQEILGQFSAWKLRNMTHEEPPWVESPQDGIISHESMETYFSTLFEK